MKEYHARKKILFQDTHVLYEPMVNTAAIIYFHKVNNRNTRKRCESCSKLTIETPERRPCARVSFLIIKENFVK